ncbi:MAG: diphthamide biosynthesis enzyme Dph2 [Thermoplasmata archaeon]|nr:diphthamide biosynthesis enzyme Dph2 [Thermoplasmata archaeon]
MMRLKYYEVSEEEILKAVEGRKRILLRMPEGLMSYSSKIASFLKENGVEAIINADGCFGACDFVAPPSLPTLCIGEAEMPYLKKTYRNVEFIEARYPFDCSFIEERAEELPEKLGIASITPFIQGIDECRRILERNGKEVFIGKKSRRTKYDGQLLGCDFSSAMQISGHVDAFLYIGDGIFHPLGLAISTGKKVYVADPIERKVDSSAISDEVNRVMKKRYAVISRAMGRKTAGIILSSKIGQRRPLLAREMIKLAEKAGIDAHMIEMNNVNETIDYLPFDFYVSTACPRVAIDDATKFRKPVLTPIEFEIIVGEREWESYEFDQIL